MQAEACRSMPQHKKFFRGTALAWLGLERLYGRGLWVWLRPTRTSVCSPHRSGPWYHNGRTHVVGAAARSPRRCDADGRRCEPPGPVHGWCGLVMAPGTAPTLMCHVCQPPTPTMQNQQCNTNKATPTRQDTSHHITTQHNTTQHNTTQHNTTQYDTTRHNTTQHNTTQHDTTQHNTTHHNTTQHDTTQHDTTRHNTTQHDTTQHNTTQHNTTQHNTTQHNTTQQIIAQHSTAQHNTTQHNTTQHNTTQHNTAQHNTAQHNTAQHNTAQHNTTQHNTAQHNTAQHSTAQHNTTQHSTAQHSTPQHTTPHHTTPPHNATQQSQPQPQSHNQHHNHTTTTTTTTTPTTTAGARHAFTALSFLHVPLQLKIAAAGPYGMAVSHAVLYFGTRPSTAAPRTSPRATMDAHMMSKLRGDNAGDALLMDEGMSLPHCPFLSLSLVALVE